MKTCLKSFCLFLLSHTLFAQVPTATIVSPSSTICTSVRNSFSATTANSPTAYSWSVSPANSLTITPDQTSPSIDISFRFPGLYTFSLQVSNATGTTIAVRTISVTQSANAAFNASLTNTGFPTQIILTNYSSNFVKNQWNYSDVAEIDTILNPIKTYTSGGTYSITLIAYGKAGCSSISVYSFKIADSSWIRLPNIFTPNNDSINDIFRPEAGGLSTINAYIFNRFGTLVYSWDKVNGYWDGYTSSGEPCQDGVYFCVLEATGFDGKSYKLKSKVTLLR
jgi:gliding motility-associated-like protein